MINEEECAKAGVARAKIESLTKRLRRIARELDDLDVVLFGGAGSLTLRYDDRSGRGRLILSHIEGPFDGGDGGNLQDIDGLLRGEE